jgi:hypothetical protein
MAVADTQARCEFFDRGAGVAPGLGFVEQARRQLGPAAQAGAEAGVLGLRGAGEEAAVFAPWAL